MKCLRLRYCFSPALAPDVSVIIFVIFADYLRKARNEFSQDTISIQSISSISTLNSKRIEAMTHLTGQETQIEGTILDLSLRTHLHILTQGLV